MTSEPHFPEKPCDICGGVGRKDVIVTCSKCCIAREHVYCMRVHTRVIPQIWVCEECLSSNSIVLPNSVQEDEFLDSRDITHTAAPSKVSVDSQGQKTGKVKYIPVAEAFVLSSRDHVKETSKSNNSRTAMSSKNVIPKLSVPIVKKNLKFKRPVAENSRLSSGAQGREPLPSNNSRTAMPSKNVNPKFAVPIVKDNPSFKLPVAENSRLSSGAQGMEPVTSNNSGTAMPSKIVIPKFDVPIVKDNPSFKVPVAENSRLSSGAQGRELTSNNSGKAMDDNPSFNLPVAENSRLSSGAQGRELSGNNSRNAMDDSPSFKLPVAENSRLSSGAQGRELASNNSRKAMPSKNVIPKFSAPTVKENPSSKRPVAKNSRLSSGVQGRESRTSHNSRTGMPSKNVIRKVSVPIEKENPSFKLPVADVAWLTSGAKRKKLHESNNFRTTMPAINVIPNFSIPRVIENHGGAQIITKIDQQTAKTSETSQEECGDKQWPVAAFMPSKEVKKFKPATKEVKTPNTNTDYASNEASYGSPTPMCSLPISTGQNLPANAGKNFPFEERVLPNVLPNLELYCQYLPSLKATWNGGFLFPETATPGEVYGGFQAHSPCKIGSKAFEFSKKLPKDLQIKLVPRCPIWQNLFGDGSPDFHDIGLYFFPADNTERSKQNYSCLFDFLETKNLVMRSYIDGVELLISTPKQLHVDCQKIISRSSTEYFWGLFRQVKDLQMIDKAHEEFLLSIAESEGSQEACQ